jgi:hypothetical protein
MQFGCGGRSKEKRNALLAEQLSHPAHVFLVNPNPDMDE